MDQNHQYYHHSGTYQQQNDRPLNFNQNKHYKRKQSFVSTRKSSTDSIQLKGKFKTQMCKYFLLQIQCPFYDLCCFAHGEDQLRIKEVIPAKYKTKTCSKFNSDGYCPYGPRCQFIHSQGNHNINYQKLVDKIRTDSQFFFLFFKQTTKKPRRLSFFEGIEEVKDFEEKDEEEQYILYNTTPEALAIRTRHNSI